jgi:hypothetical protein
LTIDQTQDRAAANPVAASLRSRLRMVATAAAALAAWAPVAAAAPTPPGTVAMQPVEQSDGLGGTMPAFVAAASEAFGARGFTTLDDPAHAGLLVELAVSRKEVGTAAAKVAPSHSSVSPGGVAGAVGGGVSIALPTGKSRLVPVQQTQLTIRIRRRGADEVVWQGAALTVRSSGVAKGGDAQVATDLTNAVLGAYPAAPDGVVSVP